MLHLESRIENLEDKINKYQTDLNSLLYTNNNQKWTTYNNYGFLTAGILGIATAFNLVFPAFSIFIATITTVGAGLSGALASLCGLAGQKNL